MMPRHKISWELLALPLLEQAMTTNNGEGPLCTSPLSPPQVAALPWSHNNSRGNGNAAGSSRLELSGTAGGGTGGARAATCARFVLTKNLAIAHHMGLIHCMILVLPALLRAWIAPPIHFLPLSPPPTTLLFAGAAKASASTLHVMLAMIGRDVADELPWVLRNVERLADKFATAHVVLVENDSRDGTASVWKRWAANYTAQDPSRRSVHLISFSAEKGKKDLSLLAVARNKYLEIIPPHVDYLIAVDTDMCFPWRVEDHLHIIDALLPYRGADWDVLYANGACGW